jgi:hypothetical protein
MDAMNAKSPNIYGCENTECLLNFKELYDKIDSAITDSHLRTVAKNLLTQWDHIKFPKLGNVTRILDDLDRQKDV